MADLTEAEVIRDLAFGAREWHPVGAGEQYAWLDAAGDVHKLDLRRDLPARKGGTVLVRDASSFSVYWDKHHDDNSEVYADFDNAVITAVLDAHEPAVDGEFDGARWQGHRLVLRLAQTLPWLTWLEHDRQMMPQAQFAEFLEDNYRDLDPGGPVSAADFLEIAQRFQAATKAQFKGGQRLATGELQFSYEETTTASAGRTGNIEIPSMFWLAIAPYDDTPGRISARFRYRLSQQQGLTLGYFLDQPERVRQDAVEAIAAQLADMTGAQIMRGSPS